MNWWNSGVKKVDLTEEREGVRKRNNNNGER
jgi:hypothetical protein